MKRWAVLGLLPLGVAWAALATAVALPLPVPIHLIAGHAAVGIAYLVAGVVGWTLRPGNRSGALLTAVAFGWFLSLFGAGAPEPWRTLARPFADVYNVFAIWLFLAYPTGFLGSRTHRVTVAGIAAILFVLDTGTLFGTGPDLVAISGIVLPLLVVALIIRRWLLATAPARRVLWPVLLAGAVLLLAVVLAQIPRLTRASQELIEVTAFVRIVAQGLVPIAFLLGLLRLRMARSAVADLVVSLRDAPSPEHLRDQLTKALGDPSIDVVKWSAEHAWFVDEAGQPIPIPPDETRAVTVLEGEGGAPLAALIHDPALLHDPALIGSVSAAVRLAVENERLHEEVRAQLEEVRASRARIVEAGDAERRRVERDLHDGAQQRLVALSLALRLARSRAGGDADLDKALGDASDELKVALGELRELARGIHPAILTEAGLGPALRSLADRSPVPVTLDASLADRLPAPVEATAYFFVSEALANVAKHARATKAEVRATRADGFLRVEVSDDGVGGADPAGGSGLRGIRDRVAAVGGRVAVDSRTGAGTRVVAELPCP